MARFKYAFKTLDAASFINNLRKFTRHRAQRLIELKPHLATDKSQNRTYSSQLVYALQFLKVAESFLWLVSFSYFFGIIWFIICDIYDEYLIRHGDLDANESFIQHYSLKEKHGTSFMAISMTYFISTTLATIGFGDFHPLSSIERATCILLMVCGVAMFSLIQQQIILAIDNIKNIYRPQQAAEIQLNQFFGVLKKFNGNTPIDYQKRHQLETYFEFVWENDKT